VFLETGKIKSPTKRRLSPSGMKDVEKELSLDLPVVNYTNDKETKDFLEKEARKLSPGLNKKSGSRYRLNRCARSSSSRESSLHTETWFMNIFGSMKAKRPLHEFLMAGTSTS
jgi:hypothetical protein